MIVTLKSSSGSSDMCAFTVLVCADCLSLGKLTFSLFLLCTIILDCILKSLNIALLDILFYLSSVLTYNGPLSSSLKFCGWQFQYQFHFKVICSAI